MPNLIKLPKKNLNASEKKTYSPNRKYNGGLPDKATLILLASLK